MPAELVRYQVGADGYQNVADYDRKRYGGPSNEYKRNVMAAVYHRMLGPLAGKKVADVGCGTGRGVADFAQSAKSVVGCDASHDMLSWARGKVKGKPCRFVQTFAQNLPLASNSFDVVTSLNFLHLFSVDTQREMVSEMKRILKPGGTLVLEFDNGLQGGVVGLVKRMTGRERGAMMPWEIRYILGSGVRVTAVHGAVFPVLWRAFWRFPRVAAMLDGLGYHFPVNRLLHRVYYRVTKD